ncbi:hypothetical protein [Novosphingobium sp. fls2-241-R2A-195]|uniref:hypothetical protein n=1 Tax=Novosphingobium sp. fls2-241-R2A-195 TaxID=3040296 RepID=UPI002550AD08|nr:hypothetical protein [Novosphingobium sp. fls2-241-R2A-195]
MRDMANHIEVRRAIAPVAPTTDNTPYVSSIIDVAGFDNLVFAILLGALADADATFAVLIEHGDAANLSDAAAAPDVALTGTEASAGFTFADDNKVRKIGYVGSKRYVRLTITPTNNTGAASIAAVAILSGSRYSPGSAQSA